MDSQLQSISKIFTEKIFRIPDYQRGYAWTEKQLKDYWTDVIQLEEGKNHYVGVLTLERVPNEIVKSWDDDKWIIDFKSFEPYYVVDGQQRLTTTIILIQSITELIPEKGTLNYTPASEIKKRFIFDSKDEGISRSYIFGYEKDNPSYEFLKSKIFNEFSPSAYSNEITIYTHNLEYAKDYFLSKLRELSLPEIEIIYKKVTQNLLFNIYTITSDIDVFIAFETMNNRGKPLSNLELLKNRLIYLSTKFDTDEADKQNLRKIINDGWKGIYHFLGLNKDKPLNDDVFLTNHCLLYFGKDIFSNEDIEHYRTRRAIFRIKEKLADYLLEQKFTVKNVIDKKVSITFIKQYVESLQTAVKIWFDILNPTSSNLSDKEKIVIERLNRIGIINYDSLLLALYLVNTNKEIVLKLLERLERLSFLHSLGSYRRFVVFTNFSFVGIRVLKKELSGLEVIKLVDEKINEMLDRKDFLDIIKENFRTTDGFYSWGGIKYFLFEYEQSIKNKSKNKKNKINWDEFDEEMDDFITVEHIFPQTVRSDCWKKEFEQYSLKERRVLNNSLGNLLPLSKPKNSSLQNKCFKDKVENGSNYVGYKYGSYSENEISGLQTWNSQDILDRGLKLLKFMEKRWQLDFVSDENRIAILNLSFLNNKK